MILVACGFKAPFNRLMRTLDAWAGTAKTRAVLAQIGESQEVPGNMDWFRHFGPHDMASILTRTDLLICDVSIPLLLEAVERNLPTLVLPRNPVFGEDSGLVQKRLAERLTRHTNIKVCETEKALLAELAKPLPSLQAPAPSSDPSRQSLCRAIEECIGQ